MSIKDFFCFIIRDQTLTCDYITSQIIKRVKHISDVYKRTFNILGRTFYIYYEEEVIYSYKNHSKVVYDKPEIKDLIYKLKKEQDELP